MGPDNFQGVTLKEVLRAVTHVLPSIAASIPASTPAPKASDRPPAAVAASPDDADKLTQMAFWQAMQGFLREGDVLIAEDGTSSAGGGALALPPRCTFITQAIWGSIDYSLGCPLGTLIAAPERRHLLFIGDGSFQFTAQELSTMSRHGLQPWIFLINTGSYTILGRRARYNDVADLRYAGLPGVFCREPRSTSRVVATVKKLRAALALPHESLMFVAAMMDSVDSPASLVKDGHAPADVDYGPRGPQHALNAQIKTTG